MNKTVLTLGAVAAVAAIGRLFTRSLFEPLGVPTFLGSVLVSVSVVLLFGLGLLFYREGRDPKGRYLKAAARFVTLAVWCELLIIGGILLTDHLHLRSYYTGPFEAVEHMFPNATAHAMGHAKGFWVPAPLLLAVGAIIYLVSKRKRHSGGKKFHDPTRV